MVSANEHHILRKKAEIVARNIAGEMILVPVMGQLADMQRIFSLNPVAEFIWNQLDGTKTLEEIIMNVQNVFDVTKEQAESDAKEFISALEIENLIDEIK